MAGHTNNDNAVDIGDFRRLVNTCGSSATLATSGCNPQADFNYDGVVDIADFVLLVNE